VTSEPITVRFCVPRCTPKEFYELERQRLGPLRVRIDRTIRIIASFVLAMFGVLYAIGIWFALPHRWDATVVGAIPPALVVILLALVSWDITFIGRNREVEVRFFAGRIEIFWPDSGRHKEYIWDRAEGFCESDRYFALCCVVDINDDTPLPKHGVARTWTARLNRWLSRDRYTPFIVPKHAFTAEQEAAFRKLVGTLQS